MPTAPPTRCGAAGCHEFVTKRGRCDEHQPKAWANRARKQDRYGMSSGTMRALKKRVAARDHNTCYVCGREADQGETYDLEHKTPISEGGSPDDMDNLGLICAEDHEIKSKAEAARANRRRTLRG
ncbi:endonuclease [Streptomyces leeuwenhoekii]|uniref:Endonuclease n=1 Tax=Streptomyces leeuwenhoekii TaxID=1437453 RepID=A0ABR5HTD4_STRLW|nr:HNH endonuclease [Streptomyces leeuwenhoekii]KMS71754.1 endonuclease [Streptomyces leeuwenhoekii]